MTNENDNNARPRNWFGALKWEGMRAKDRANEKRANSYAFAWVGLLVAANFLRQLDIVPELAALGLVLASTIPGALFVKAYLKMLREADEMLRQMQYEALAVGFGAGALCGLTALFLFPPGPIWGFSTLIPMVIGFCVRVILAGRKIAQESSANEESDGAGK